MHIDTRRHGDAMQQQQLHTQIQTQTHTHTLAHIQCRQVRW